jgi:hypothetical protein
MSWNYRVVRFPHSQADIDLAGHTHYYAIHSVYYTEGNPDGISEGPAILSADTPEDVLAELRRMVETFERDGVLNCEDIAGYGPGAKIEAALSKAEGRG